MAVTKVVSGTNPAANTEVTVTVPTGKFWRVKSVKLPLVQGITQTPQPELIFDDGATIIYETFGASAAQAVSTTCVYSFAPGLPGPAAIVGAGADGHALCAIPDDVVLPPGGRIRTNTLGIGANTDYGVPVVEVIEYDADPFSALMSLER